MRAASTYSPLTPRALAIAPIIWVGKILFIVGFVTNSWYSLGIQHTGLWVTCNTLGVYGCFYFDPLDSWYIAVRALECIALIFISVGSFQSLIYMRRRFKERLIIGAVAVLIGGLFGIIGCIVYGAEVASLGAQLSPYLGYSFYLTVVGCIISMVGAPLLFLEYRSAFH